MKLVSAIALTLLIAPLAAEAAPKHDVPTPMPLTAMGGPCDLTGFKVTSMVLAPAFNVPDNNSGDSLVTTMNVPDDSTEFATVIAAVKIAHTWVGDVVLRLEYFDNCAAASPVVSVNLICRPRGTATATPAPCGPGTVGSVGAGSNIGTSATDASNLPALYYFSDDALGLIADGANPGLTPAGCYKPSVGLMSEFAGLRKGGCFKLYAADYAVDDFGTIEELHVYSLNSGNVPTRAASWGRLKSLYR